MLITERAVEAAVAAVYGDGLEVPAEFGLDMRMALHAAAPHMLSDIERELTDAKRVIALLVAEAGGKVTISRKAITEISDATVLETTQDVINGGWVIRARDPRG